MKRWETGVTKPKMHLGVEWRGGLETPAGGQEQVDARSVTVTVGKKGKLQDTLLGGLDTMSWLDTVRRWWRSATRKLSNVADLAGTSGGDRGLRGVMMNLFLHPLNARWQQDMQLEIPRRLLEIENSCPSRAPSVCSNSTDWKTRLNPLLKPSKLTNDLFSVLCDAEL